MKVYFTTRFEVAKTPQTHANKKNCAYKLITVMHNHNISQTFMMLIIVFSHIH